jgi:type I restriction enzyme M protein
LICREGTFCITYTYDEVRDKGSNLSIPLYVRTGNGNGTSNRADETISLKQAIANWQASSKALRETMEGLFKVLERQAENSDDSQKTLKL